MDKAREVKTLSAIVQHLASTHNWKSIAIPKDYLVLDVETTGFSSVRNRTVSVGLCAVRDGEVCADLHDGNSANIILKWPESVFEGCQKAIDIHGIDYAVSQRDGVQPAEAMHIVSEAIAWARDNNMYIVGHNMLNFDMGFLGAEFDRAGLTTKITPSEVIDTAAFCKAMQLSMLPGPQEATADYYRRVMNFRAKGVYFNLDRYCTSRFGLIEKYGASVDSAHNSGYDCWLTHLVIKELNIMLGAHATETADDNDYVLNGSEVPF